MFPVVYSSIIMMHLCNHVDVFVFVVLISQCKDNYVEWLDVKIAKYAFHTACTEI